MNSKKSSKKCPWNGQSNQLAFPIKFLPHKFTVPSSAGYFKLKKPSKEGFFYTPD
jgi:hypothetical protein